MRFPEGNMGKDWAEALLAKVDRLEQRLEDMSASEAEESLFDDVLRPLLEAEGYEVEYRHGPGDQGIDYLARKGSDGDIESLGIQYKGAPKPPVGYPELVRDGGREDRQRLGSHDPAHQRGLFGAGTGPRPGTFPIRGGASRLVCAEDLGLPGCPELGGQVP